MAQVAGVYSFTSENMASLMTGVGISSIVFLILTAQVWIYFRRHKIRSRENKQSKALVAFIWLMQATQLVVTSGISCVHTMEFEDIPNFMGYLSMEWALYTGIDTLTTSLVHSVFIYRVFRIEKCLCGRRRISFVLIAFCVLEQGFGLLGAIFIIKLRNHPDNNPVITWPTLTSLGCSAINDVLIAGTLAYILNKHRTVSPRTNQMITKLIIFCSQTGLITTVAASITIAIWAIFRFDLCHLYMCFPIGGCEILLVVNLSIQNVLTSCLDSICYMSSRQLHRSGILPATTDSSPNRYFRNQFCTFHTGDS
ncbi:hypothetical protein BD769DRAFT_301033 [Suillus cothurnatus]|nr:hypothetical protein BD769DRAFT_301033 [Suillus cothurnatus]